MNQSRGNTHLRSIKAKYKLLYFWVSRCDSCFKDMELLKEQYNRIKEKDLKILTVNVDVVQNMQHRFAKFNIPLIQLYQGSFTASALFRSLNIKSVPFLLLLDETDKIIEYSLKIEDLSSIVK